jgi:hypothetical protein
MQFLQKIPPWCDKMPKINLRDRGFIGLRKWNLGVVTSREEGEKFVCPFTEEEIKERAGPQKK